MNHEHSIFLYSGTKINAVFEKYPYHNSLNDKLPACRHLSSFPIKGLSDQGEPSVQDSAQEGVCELLLLPCHVGLHAKVARPCTEV